MKTKEESKSAWRAAVRAVALAMLPLAALTTGLILFSLALRHGGARVRDEVRAFNKRLLNPAMMKLAGRRHWYAAVIRHKGRRSGREYATPVVAVPVAADAFIIPLPYGEGVDWLKNVLAAKRATLESKGEGTVRRMTGWNWRRWFAAPPEQRGFWYGLIDQILATRLTKGDLIRALEEMLDYGRRNFGPYDLAGWPGRILMIESEHDQAFSPEARAALRALYPQSSVRIFADAGHAVMVTDPAKYIAAVRSFLKEPSTTARDPAAANTAKAPAAFPLQLPGRVMRSFFKAGVHAYLGLLALLMGANAMLLLTTTGRRSGLPRKTALTFLPLEGRYLVVAGMGARSDRYQNLLAEPRVEVQIGTRQFAAVAEPVLDPERRRMLAPGIGTQWDRFGPPRPARWLLRRLAHFDYDAELDYTLAHAEELPMVELVPSPSPPPAPSATVTRDRSVHIGRVRRAGDMENENRRRELHVVG